MADETSPETPQKMLKARWLTIASLVGGAVLLRVIPHPWNIAPIGGLALFAGAHFRQKRWGFAVPLLAMLVSDLILYSTARYRPFAGAALTTAAFVYGSYAAIACLGLWLRTRRTAVPIALSSLGASALFFVVTNFGVWACFGTYPKTLEGLLTCYAAALPFFHRTVLSDAVFVTVLFGGFAMVSQRVPSLWTEERLPADSAQALAE